MSGGVELTEQETAIYDRQIRIWGVDAQRRLSKSSILVCGITGPIVEFCKNVVLAGIGSLALMDDRVVSEEDLAVNFLICPNEIKSMDRSISEVCCESLREFNPMVNVSVEKGSLSNQKDDFLDQFDAVVVGRCYLNTKVEINLKCRKRTKKIAFYTVDCRGSCGEIFVDLQTFKFAKKNGDKVDELELHYPSFQDAISVQWTDLPKNVTKLYFVMRVIEKYEQDSGCLLGGASSVDFEIATKLQQDLCQFNSVDESFVPISLLRRVLESTEEHPPVSAIIGGILGQEVIKAMSGKGEPLKNFFFFDAANGKGIIEDVSRGK